MFGRPRRGSRMAPTRQAWDAAGNTGYQGYSAELARLHSREVHLASAHKAMLARLAANRPLWTNHLDLAKMAKSPSQ
jgi:hypothetical protein